MTGVGMFGQKARDQSLPYSQRRLKLYKEEKSFSAYVDDDLQFQCKEEVLEEKIQNLGTFQKLLHHYQQKQKGESSIKERVDNRGIEEALEEMHKSYRVMMEVKGVLDNAYNDLIEKK